MATDESLQCLFQKFGFKSLASEIPSSQHDILSAFLQKEFQIRQDSRIARLLLACGIRKSQIRTFDDFDWSFNSLIPKHDLLVFRDSNWISNAKNLVLIGDPGIGKTHIAKALCYDAVLKGSPALFISAFDLISKVKKAALPQSRLSYFTTFIKVLCIDELGYTVYQKDDMDILFQIISKRSEISSTVITTNLVPNNWGTIFSGTTASAILDRLHFNGLFLSWEGKSYRQFRKH